MADRKYFCVLIAGMHHSSRREISDTMDHHHLKLPFPSGDPKALTADNKLVPTYARTMPAANGKQCITFTSKWGSDTNLRVRHGDAQLAARGLDLGVVWCGCQQPWEYTALMQDAKLAPAPRGSGPFSFRLYEALEYGAVPIIPGTWGVPSRLSCAVASPWCLAEDSHEYLTENAFGPDHPIPR